MTLISMWGVASTNEYMSDLSEYEAHNHCRYRYSNVYVQVWQGRRKMSGFRGAH